MLKRIIHITITAEGYKKNHMAQWTGHRLYNTEY